MVNKYQGEVSLVSGDVTYTMRMTIREMIKVEAHFDKSWNACVSLINDDMKLGDLLIYVKACLSGSHPGLSDDEVCEIITQAGIVTVINKMVEAINAAMPGVAEDAKSNRPPA